MYFTVQIQVDPRRHGLGEVNVQRVFMLLYISPKNRYNDSVILVEEGYETPEMNFRTFRSPNVRANAFGHSLYILVV